MSSNLFFYKSYLGTKYRSGYKCIRQEENRRKRNSFEVILSITVQLQKHRNDKMEDSEITKS